MVDRPVTLPCEPRAAAYSERLTLRPEVNLDARKTVWRADRRQRRRRYDCALYGSVPRRISARMQQRHRAHGAKRIKADGYDPLRVLWNARGSDDEIARQRAGNIAVPLHRVQLVDPLGEARCRTLCARGSDW
jgi:hypothetical protein